MFAKGLKYEKRAQKILENNGLRLVSKNYHAKTGEIDLIMRDKQTLVFVEVRYRKSTSHGNASESITPVKMKRIINTATSYLNRHKEWNNEIRFDVVAFTEIGDAKTLETIWHKSAFDLTDIQ